MTSNTSRKFYARITGFLYLLIIILGLIAQVFVRDRLVDYGNATVTLRNIEGSPFWFRFGFVAELLMLVSDTIVTMFLFVLLQHVSRNAALLSTFFRLVSISILSVTALSHYAVVLIVGGDEYMLPFNSHQRNAMALLSLKLHGSGYNISLFFFGFHLLFLGHLIFKSIFLPRLLGLMLQVAAFCYIGNSLIWFLFPGMVASVYPAIMIPCFLAELFLSLWLLIKGTRANGDWSIGIKSDKSY